MRRAAIGWVLLVSVGCHSGPGIREDATPPVRDGGSTRDTGPASDGGVVGDAALRDGGAPSGRVVDHGVVLSSGLSGFVASDPSVQVLGDGTLAMVYTDVDPATDNTVLMWTTSPRPDRWTTGTVLLRGRADAWDEAVEAGALAPGGAAVLYGGYRRGGVPADGFPADQGLLERIGTDWVRQADPVWRRRPDAWDCDAVYSVDVVGGPGDFHAVYAAHCYTAPGVAHGAFVGGASGPTLRELTPTAEPLLAPDALPAWSAAYAAEPSLVDLGDCWALLFTGFPDWDGGAPSLGLATARAPLGPFAVHAEPLLRPDADWREAWVGAPDVVVRDGVAHVFVTGVDGRGVTSIGYLEVENPAALWCP